MITLLRAAARAKLNLNLHITGRRGDGYHLLDSLVVFTEIADEISVATSDSLSLKIDGPFAEAAGSDNNLVLRAAQLLQRETRCTKGAAIQLTKYIPVGAGLGGGSADAATTLQLLNQLWELKLNDAQLAELGLLLGADVPMCLLGRAVHVQGIGEILAPVKLPALHAVLVHPRLPLLTKDVYYEFKPTHHVVTMQKPNVANGAELMEFLADGRNDLQSAAITLQPQLDDVLGAIEKTSAAFARMTGSGACCFGLFEIEAEAQRAAALIAAQHAEWWIAATRIG